MVAPALRRYVTTQRVSASPRERIIEIPWTKPGPVTVGESPAMRPSANVTFDGFSVNVTTPGGGATVVVLKKNGVVIATCTVDAGTPYAHISIPSVQLIGRVDNYSIAITQTPGDAADSGGSIEIGGGSDGPQGGGPIFF